MKRTYSILVLITLSVCVFSCKTDSSEVISQRVTKPTLFTLLPPEKTQISFQNSVVEGLNTNVLMYEYFYNGAGVATADLNGDGLPEVYFTSNMEKNHLYLNKGNLKFEDVTAIAGVEGRPGPWKTGVTFADVNGDGKMDIYVCYSGTVKDENRKNQLFINTGNDSNNVPHFSEQAEAYGLASHAYSNQGYFFDFDRDADLDLLLLNHNPESLPILNEVGTREMLKKDDPLKGIRLYKQTNGKFEDITVKSGINGSALAYGLGAGLADINEDGWTDVYISNDYAVPDYLYINNGNGTFTNRLEEHLRHTSQFSMGNDVADVNNDGAPEILTLDMLPEDNARQKLLMAPDNYGKFEHNVRSGFYYQYMRNMLQLNNGNGTFSEVGQLAGVSNTDWSWAALLADYDNSGTKDLFITNGYLRDYTNLDFIKYMDDFVKAKGRLKREDVLEIIKKMPSSNLVNYIFSNSNGLNFTNETVSWGMDQPSNSNGAAYCDLDNDGDLDIVVNNINSPAFVFENNASRLLKNNFVRIELKGEGANTQGLGARVDVWSNGIRRHVEQMPTRGYLSTVSPVLHVGLGQNDVDSIVVHWLSGKRERIKQITANSLITLSEKNASAVKTDRAKKTNVLFTKAVPAIQHLDKTPLVNDFKRQSLLNTQLSYTGPVMIKGDVNGDKKEDVFIGGGNGQPASLHIQQSSGSFRKKEISVFAADQKFIDVAAAFVDIENDGDLDLYCASGGYHMLSFEDPLLQDRLYVNDGKGNFAWSSHALPQMLSAKSCVAANDVNGDGFMDLFVGSHATPGRYPEASQSYLLINQGNGTFVDKLSSYAPELQRSHLITDVAWVDINNDKSDDLVVVGEWMPVSVFIASKDKLQNETQKHFKKNYSGWWNKIGIGDFNNDGRKDLIVGNLGLNTQCRASDDQPAEMHFKDFDKNGSVDPILSFYIQGKSYPYLTRDELLEQLSFLRRRFTDYKSYANVVLTDIFKPDELTSANHLIANHFETTYFQSGSDGIFSAVTLPVEVQYSPVHTITISDFDGDKIDDILLCGNDSKTRLKMGRMDANYGQLLKGDGNGNLQYVKQSLSGLDLRYDVRCALTVGSQLFIAATGQSIQTYSFERKRSLNNLAVK